MVLSLKVMKYLAPPTEVVFIEPHKSMCTNSKGDWWFFWGFPFWNGFLHCLPTTQPLQKSSWWLVLAFIPTTMFFCKRSFKFCLLKWPNLSFQIVKFSFSLATWALSLTTIDEYNSLYNVFLLTLLQEFF